MALFDPPKKIYLKINNIPQEALLALPNFTQSYFDSFLCPWSQLKRIFKEN